MEVLKPSKADPTQSALGDVFQGAIEQVLNNLQCVIVTAVTHHEQPTRQPLLEAMHTVARY